jgi:hypothetical protein
VQIGQPRRELRVVVLRVRKSVVDVWVPRERTRGDASGSRDATPRSARRRTRRRTCRGSRHDPGGGHDSCHVAFVLVLEGVIFQADSYLFP